MSILAGLALAMISSASPTRIEPQELRATVEKLSSWRTRNTNTPELVEAANWVADQYRTIPGAQVELMKYSVRQGPRVPSDREVVQVVAILPPNKTGGGGPVIMGAHIDTINMQADVYRGRAPGANDDGSGVAGSLAVAKRLATTEHSHPFIFVAFSGEEQGLLGSTALAARALAEKWPIEAVLSNDMIGNSGNLAGQTDPGHVRLFSEENPKHQSRELARYLEWLQRDQGDRNFRIKLVFRPDRFGRGGDHTPFNNQGFTAVRFVEMHEEYSRQHTELDLPTAVDYGYLARIAKVNLLAMKCLGNAGAPPSHVRVDRRQNHDTKITWTSTPGVNYVVYWRDTTEPTWSHFKKIGEARSVEFKMTGKDENFFAVGAEGGIPIIAS